MSETTILFCTDLHGSEMYFRKILTIALKHKPDILLISGDLTGKSIIPIIKIDEDKYLTEVFGHRYEGKGEQGLRELQERIRASGYYDFVTTLEELQEIQEDKKKIDELFDKVMQEGIRRWIKTIEEKLPPDMKVIMNPGNDDRFVIDDIIKESDRVLYTLGSVEYLDDFHPMVSCEWVNFTPFESPRECSEEELEERLVKEISKVDEEKIPWLICDFHAPPYNTPLDLAPKLDKELKPVTILGNPIMEHVGSTAVRKVIEEYQPKALLCGHIHESAGVHRIGRTVCINPGSEYVEGIMHGYLVKLTSDKDGIDYYPVMGG